MTVRETIDIAVALYDQGKWKEALTLLVNVTKATRNECFNSL